jgi:organic radical activating enzyme
MTLPSKSCALKGNQKVFYLHQNKIASCCRAESETLNISRDLNWYLDKWQQESQQLDLGIQLPGCNHCWKKEAQAQVSMRSTTRDSNTIELCLSNLCNQMCSYCSPKYSSAWQDSIEEYGMFKNISNTAIRNLQPEHASENVDYWMDQIDQYISQCDDHSVELKILGGEPLMQQRNLQKLLTVNPRKIKKILVHTNLNPPTNKFLLWLIQNVDADILEFTVSLDASPQYNQWPRARFNQVEFDNNLQLLQNNQIAVSLNAVVSVLSVFDLQNYISWAREKNIHIYFNQLQNPDCLEALLIPYKFRSAIWDLIKHLDPPAVILKILQHKQHDNSLRLFEQYNYLHQYFQRNDLDPANYDNALFREYWTWLTKNFKNTKIS